MSAFTPRATDYLIDPEHPESIHGATYRSLPCGCEVIGNGTLPAPLTVKQCRQCAASSALLKALEKAAGWLDSGAYPNDYDPEWKLLEADRKLIAAVIAAAKGEAVKP